MEQDTLFHCRPSSKSKRHQYVLLAFLFLPLGCILSSIGSMTVAIIVDKVLNLKSPLAILLLALVIFITFMGYNILKNGLSELTITENEINWQTTLGKVFTFNKNEITNVKLRRPFLVFNEANELRIDTLQVKNRVQFSNVFLQWVPHHTLNEELSRFFHSETHNDSTQEIEYIVSTKINQSLNPTSRYLIFAFILLLISLTISAIVAGAGPKDILGTLSCPGVIFIILIFGIWRQKITRTIRIQNDGVLFEHGKQSYLFHWGDIEMIDFHIEEQHLLIWENGKKSKLSYTKMESEKVAEVANVIYHTALSKDIPVGII